MKKSTFQITQTTNAIDKINLSKSVKTYHFKQNENKCAEYINDCIDLEQFAKLIASGYSFHHHFDFEKIKSNIANLVTADDNIYANYIHHDILCKNKITNNILQLPSIAKYCQFQYVFFDVIGTDFIKLISNRLKYKPNIIYTPMISSNSTSVFRLVYIFDNQIPCKYYSDVYDTLANELKFHFSLNNSVKFPTKTLFGTDSDVYILNKNYYAITEKSPCNDLNSLLFELLNIK